jgi:adenosine deaminase
MDMQALAAVPKIQLHDHLDGGLRTQTIIELAERSGYEGLPSTDPEELARWFSEPVRIGGLPGYLSTFDHTIAVMQTEEAIERVAYESAADLAADQVIYAEVRFAPEWNTQQGLALDDVIGAALAGFARARREHAIDVRLIVDAMRNMGRSQEAAEAAVRWADSGVVGFDIAGPEAGYPPAEHLAAFDIARRGGLGITIHAGEGDGLASIAEALNECGAERIGHGVRISDDIEGDRLGALAKQVRDSRVPLELCPRSNADTGAVDSLRDHPIDRLMKLGFNVTVNCDNRLMSSTSPTVELAGLVETFAWGSAEIRQVTLNAAAAAFVDDSTRRELTARIESFYAT